jgi:hypothetical protein
MDAELKARLDALEIKIDKAYHAAESARKYLFWTGIITIILFVLPLIGLVFVIPQFLASYTGALQGLGF